MKAGSKETMQSFSSKAKGNLLLQAMIENSLSHCHACLTTSFAASVVATMKIFLLICNPFLNYFFLIFFWERD